MTEKSLNFDVDTLKALLNQIERMPDMLSCEETFRVLDEYVDRLTQGESVDTIMPAVKYHLDICDDCGTQFELLRDIIIGELRGDGE